MKVGMFSFALLPLFLSLAHAEDFAGGLLPKSAVVFGGLVDAYIAYDLNRPSQFDRAFSTVAARHNEFNVNMALLEVKVETSRVRGRVALQAGTEVQALYRDEPTTGVISSSTLSRHIQEAYAGYRFGEEFWLDAGILASNLGFESMITKENWLYTHSLMSDLTPYYEAGVRASFRVIDGVTAQIHMLNGWRNISENNAAKGFGFRLEYIPEDWLVMTYNAFAGKEVGDRRRLFQDGRLKIQVSERLEFAAIYGFGAQTRADSMRQEWWQTGTLLTRYQWSPKFALAARGEVFSDPNRIVAKVTTPNGFFVWGSALGADYSLATNLLARLEIRHLWSQDSIFPSKGLDSRLDTSGVLSWSLWF